MLDIKGIKEKINEITQLAESSYNLYSNSYVTSLFNMIKRDTSIQEIYYDNGGDDFERDLLDRCEEYIENDDYHLDRPYQDIEWIRVDDMYLNYEEIWSDWKDFCENMDKPKAPEDDGSKEWLDESVLMEMPATNYTSFDIKPYIICDTEYMGDNDEDNVYDDPDAYVTPLSEYISNKHSNPSWVNDMYYYNRDKPLCLPELNKTLNTQVVCIIGHPGYYDGMTVGIVSREWEHDVLTDNFTEMGADNEGHTLYTMDMLQDDSQAFTESEAEQEWTKKILEPEIEKAIHVIIETQAIAGGRLYPNDMGYNAPKTSGEEFDESVKYGKEKLTETVNPNDLPDPSWYDESMSVGDTLSNKYMGYPIFIECCRDDEDEEEIFYNLQIFLPYDKFSEDPIEEANFTYWNDMIYYLKEYVLEHPLNPNSDEPYIENEPEDEGNNWLEESIQLNENDEPDNIEKPKKSGEEFDEVLDIKGIKKQINEIVKLAG